MTPDSCLHTRPAWMALLLSMLLLAISGAWCHPVYSQPLSQMATMAKVLPGAASGHGIFTASASPGENNAGMSWQKVPASSDKGNGMMISIAAVLVCIVALCLFYAWHRRRLSHEKARCEDLENQLLLARLTLDTVPLNIFWYDSDFKVSMVNEAACRATGLSRRDLAKKNLADFDPEFPEDELGRRKAWERIKAQGHFTHYGHLCNTEAACHPTEEQVSYLSSPAGDYAVVISQDITERMAQERKLKQNAVELVRAKDMAETANRLKSEFLSNMSHEIRTPMNAIIGYSEMLAQANLSEREKEYVETIIKSGKALIVIINDILDLSKIEAGRLKICLQPVDTASFFQNLGAMFRERAAGKGLQLQIDIEKNIPTPVIFDETRLRQVLFNLVGNAVTFTDQGHVCLRVRHQVISANKVSLAIAVEDSGMGISEADQETLFEPFRKGSDEQAARNSGSSGLGLALSHRLVKLMGGTLSLTSVPGRGSTFEILLPEIEVTAKAPLAPALAPQERLTFLGGHVLVVDDVHINCRLINDFFRNSPVKISAAANGKEALALLRQEKPDLILMDLKMPVMDGYQATTIIKQDPELAAIPVVAMSASVLSFDSNDSLFDGSLTKPFQISDLEGQLARFLRYECHDQELPTSAATISPRTPLAPDLIKKIQDIIARHDTKSGNLSAAALLGQEIEELGHDENIPHLAETGKKLWACAEKFDILNVEQLQAELQRFTQETNHE